MNDILTGLYNRPRFFELLNKMVQDAVEFSAPMALLIIDIQRFNKINKHFGHHTGDAVLKAIADVLKQVSRKGDYLARIGDDQFALILDRVANIGHAQLAAMKIQRLLDLPITVGERDIRCNAVIGISLCPANADTATVMLQSAELALAEAKYLEQPIGFSKISEEEGISEDWDIEVSLGDSIPFRVASFLSTKNLPDDRQAGGCRGSGSLAEQFPWAGLTRRVSPCSGDDWISQATDHLDAQQCIAS